jgi:uncharacterized protein (DUF1697 family)
LPVFISLLRGINVGGHKRIKMADLRTLYESLDLREPKTLLQTGNVVFDTDFTDPARLAAHIEKGIEDAYGFHSDIIIRSVDELAAAIEGHPFSDEQLADPKKIALMFLQDAPDAEAINILQEAHTGPEDIVFNGMHAYAFYPNGMGRSKLTNAFIERKINMQGTMRNWNTSNKLRAMAEDYQP